MNIFRCFTAATLAALCALAGAANAQVFRAYLSSTGNDANPCSVSAPCRLLPAAISAVASGGEIWILDSANYNTSTVNITKSVTILAVPGVVGSLVSSGSTDAVVINTAGVQVVLRNLVIVPIGGPGASGIHMTAGDRLSVEGCEISGLGAGSAIHVETAARVKIIDSTFRNNDTGVLAEKLASVDIARSKFFGHSATAIIASGNAVGITGVRIFDAVITENLIGAAATSALANAQAVIQANRVTASRNSNFGFVSEGIGSGIAAVSLGNSMVAKNGTGLFQSGTNATIRSIGDNVVTDNTTDVTGTITPLAPR
jgi:hypothetical protein